MLAVVALAVGGTLLPFTLFAYGQSRVSAEVAGAFLNLEPLVGAVAGAVVFRRPGRPAQIAGGAAIVVGIGLSSLPLLAGRRRSAAAPLALAVRAAGPGRRGAAGPDSGRCPPGSGRASRWPRLGPLPARLWPTRGWQHMKVHSAR